MWPGSVLLSLLFMISVRELAVIYDVGEVEVQSAFLVEHLVATLGG